MLADFAGRSEVAALRKHWSETVDTSKLRRVGKNSDEHIDSYQQSVLLPFRHRARESQVGRENDAFG